MDNFLNTWPLTINATKTGKGIPVPDQQDTIKSRRLGAYKSKIIISGLRIRIHLIRIPIRIGIQYFRLNINPFPDPIRIQGFDDQKRKKITAEKTKFVLDKKLQLTYP